MRTAHSPTVRASVGIHQMSATVGSCVVRSSSEQVWTSLQSWPLDITSSMAKAPYRDRTCTREGRGPARRSQGPVLTAGICTKGDGRECTVRSNASWIVVTWNPTVDKQTHAHDWKCYLPATSSEGGKDWFA